MNFFAKQAAVFKGIWGWPTPRSPGPEWPLSSYFSCGLVRWKCRLHYVLLDEIKRVMLILVAPPSKFFWRKLI